MKRTTTTRTAKERPDFDWDKELAKLEKKAYYKDESRKLYAERKLKDGVLFLLKGCMVKFTGEEKEREAWAAGVYVAGKLAFFRCSANDRRIKRLKRQAVSVLLETAKKGMVNTRRFPWLPHRYQSMKNPAFILYGADSKDSDFEGAKFKKELQLFDAEKLNF